MIAIPALDLRGGACVQLVGGSYEHEAVRQPDPIAVAARWAGLGFRRLHVVDLDAATGCGENHVVVAGVLGAARDHTSVQVGGGVRDEGAVARWLAAGARHVVLGTRALSDPAWLLATAAAFPDRLIVAVDVRAGKVLVRGWTETIAQPLEEVLASLEPLSLAGVLVTAVHKEGALAGPDLELMDRVTRLTRHPVQAAGGITTLEDLIALERLGVSAVVVGMALYTGRLDPERLALEYSA